MELVVLGCSGSVAGPNGPASGYVVRSEGTEDLLMDIGPGVLAAMQSIDDIDPAQCHMAFSHMHADHCLDFPSLLVWRRFHPHAPSGHSHDFIGPRMAFEHLSRAAGDYLDKPDDFSDTFNVSHYQVGSSHFDATSWPSKSIGGLTVYAAEAVHTTESYLLRVHDEQGASLVYTGDTAYTENLTHLAEGADVLLCEATWCDREFGMPQGMHMCGQDAGKIAEKAGVGTLILTHIPPWGDDESAITAAKRHFTGPVEVAYPGMRVQWGS
ncbi:MBL fold metallo-hydrolase [uncultured Corynebacterium sp.]|uniref:MBL fold metallo-hydrolase n=1 Tax=uncultured Corynebacterium sp. TaxID=159447 RepID=UPI0025E239AC|nr:MBL fold metallo-hydrolase [uncultured Corynebacterium sp.]